MTEPIKVWRWRDAPEDYRALSRHGGDEDWVALIPKGYLGGPPEWAESGTPFGHCDVSQHFTNDGMVLIGAHA